MIKGKIFGEEFTITSTKDNNLRIRTESENTKKYLKSINGRVFNPMTYKSYYTSIPENSEMVAYLLLEQDEFVEEITEHPEIPRRDGVIY